MISDREGLSKGASCFSSRAHVFYCVALDKYVYIGCFPQHLWVDISDIEVSSKRVSSVK